jgi:hypothetical protein
VSLNPVRKLIGGAFVFERAGAIPRRRIGKAWRSARGRRAGQSGDGVSREAGRAYCLLDSGRDGSHRHEQDPRSQVRFSPAVAKKEKAIGVIGAERNAKAERWAEAVLVSS